MFHAKIILVAGSLSVVLPMYVVNITQSKAELVHMYYHTILKYFQYTAVLTLNFDLDLSYVNS